MPTEKSEKLFTGIPGRVAVSELYQTDITQRSLGLLPVRERMPSQAEYYSLDEGNFGEELLNAEVTTETSIDIEYGVGGKRKVCRLLSEEYWEVLQLLEELLRGGVYSRPYP